MTEEENHRELIDKYLQNKIDEGDLHKLEQLFEDKPGIKRLVAEEKKLVSALETNKIIDLRQHLMSVSSKTPASHKKKNGFWLAAASVSVLVASMVYFFYFSGSSPSLYDQYYDPYPAVGIQRSANSEADDGLTLYTNGQYKEALLAFDSINFSARPAYYLFKGNCHLQLNQVDEAIESFNMLINESEDVILMQHAQWYLALAYLKGSQKGELTVLLQGIDKSNGIYSKEAKALLKKI